MSAGSLAAQAAPKARRRAWLRLLISLEATLCYTTPVLVLVLGTMFTPFLLLRATAHPDSPSFAIIAEVVLGWAGLIGVIRLLYGLWTTRALRNSITAAGLACGVAALVLAWYVVGHQADPGLVAVLVYVPLACTAHLVFLGRRSLFG